ncbi:MAG: D-alanine--D-alanine ligase [Phycisphaerae bacterium]|nr:D-alanine--D-alanine ligase [Phycisphaerae bacterium]
MTTVLVLGGGPDAERDVSLKSAAGVADALRQSGTFSVEARTIDRLTLDSLRALPGDVVFPVLHGAFGEGGPLQDLLELDGRPYVGCRPRAARLAMDKLATKLAALAAAIPTADACVLNPKDDHSPVGVPAVVKPVHDGSSVGLHICPDLSAWNRARAAVADDQKKNPGRAYLVERYIAGKELTVGLLDGKALPLIHIAPAHGVYDYEAKYARDDTRYILDPDLPGNLASTIKGYAERLFAALGARHVSRADFILDHDDRPWLLEINTMPGFTSHSLVPKAAAHAGIPMPNLCARLVDMALRA